MFKKKRKNNNISPDTIKKRLKIRSAKPSEQRRLRRISQDHLDVLCECTNIFNEHCEYPWHVIGSIAFIMNSFHTKKQTQDVDIIFHENDFDKIKKKLVKKGFEEFIAKDSLCLALRGNLKSSSGKKIPVEAFAQKTEEPNGFVNPGAKNTKQEVIRIKIFCDKDQEFFILNKQSQMDLYFKSLVLELSTFNLETLIGKEEKEFHEKSDKFINRLINLLELNNNNFKKLILELNKMAKTKRERKYLWDIKKITEEFVRGPEHVLSKDNLQQEIEQLKKIIGQEISEMKKEYFLLEKKSQRQKYKNSLFNRVLFKPRISGLKEQIENSMVQRKLIMKKLKGIYEEYHYKYSRNEDLPLYVFIRFFEENFVKEYCKKISKFR